MPAKLWRGLPRITNDETRPKEPEVPCACGDGSVPERKRTGDVAKASLGMHLVLLCLRVRCSARSTHPNVALANTT